MAIIDTDLATQRLSGLSGWALEQGTLVREFAFGGFPEALTFVVRLGFAAEAADHHPDILLSYKAVRLTYVTHSAGGLTVKDFEGAEAASTLAATMGGA